MRLSRDVLLVCALVVFVISGVAHGQQQQPQPQPQPGSNNGTHCIVTCPSGSGVSTPAVRVVSPVDGSFITSTTVVIEFAVLCAAYPCDTYVRYWDVSSDLQSARIDGATTVSLANLFTGSYFVRLTLHDAATDAVLDDVISSFEVVPPGSPQVNTSYASMTQAGVQPTESDVALPPTAPLSVLFVGDTSVFDGMKAFFVDYMRAMQRRGVRVAYLDPTCAFVNVDTDGVAFPHIPELDTVDNPVVRAVRATGIRFMSWCMQCPYDACGDDGAATFETFTGPDGPLARAASFADLPPAWASMLRPIGEAVGAYDAIVMAWREDKPQGSSFFIAQAGRLANPALVRFVDLGPGYTLVPPDVWVADQLMVPSHFVKHRPTVTATELATQVTQPLIDTDTYSPRPVDAGVCAAKYGKAGGGGGVLVGYVARLTSTKGPGLFLRAAAALHARHPSARFVMVGRPRHEPYETAVRDLIRRLGLTDVVRVVGFLNRDQLLELYGCMDVMLCTSATTYETFGIVNAEAMSMAIPVVHFGVAGIQDYVVDGAHSVLAKGWTGDAIADAVTPLVNNPELRRQMGHNGRQFVTSYLSEHVTAPRVISLFRRLSAAARLDKYVKPVLEAALVQANPGTGAGTEQGQVLVKLQFGVGYDDTPTEMALGVHTTALDRLFLERHATSHVCFQVVAPQPNGQPQILDTSCTKLLEVLASVGDVLVPMNKGESYMVHAWVQRHRQRHRQFQVSRSVTVQ